MYLTSVHKSCGVKGSTELARLSYRVWNDYKENMLVVVSG